MNRSSVERLEELPERGLFWAKEQFETALSQTEDYVREKPAQSLLYAFIAGYILNSPRPNHVEIPTHAIFVCPHFGLRSQRLAHPGAGINVHHSAGRCGVR